MYIAIGHDNFINADRVIAVLKPGSSPMRRLKEQARERGLLVDATGGKPTRSFILMGEGTVILSVNTPATLLNRLGRKTGVPDAD